MNPDQIMSLYQCNHKIQFLELFMEERAKVPRDPKSHRGALGHSQAHPT